MCRSMSRLTRRTGRKRANANLADGGRPLGGGRPVQGRHERQEERLDGLDQAGQAALRPLLRRPWRFRPHLARRSRSVRNFYSENNWLCGKWSSAWMAAVAPDSGTTLKVTGSIIEFLVPLTAQTQYGHYQKLAYQNGHHVWQRTTTPPTRGHYQHRTARTQATRSAPGRHLDQRPCLRARLHLSGFRPGSAAGLRHRSQNGQMYAFQSVSVLGNPEAGMKQPTVGFSLQPYVAYDQFGPAPLFTLPSATYRRSWTERTASPFQRTWRPPSPMPAARVDPAPRGPAPGTSLCRPAA